MEGPPTQQVSVKTLPIICIAFIAMIVMMVIFIQPQVVRGVDDQGFEVVIVIGFMGLLGGLAYAQFKLRSKLDGSNIADVPPSKFMTHMLISLAFIELCALMGVFIVRDQLMSTVMPIASIVAIALFVLPSVLQYSNAVSQKK